MLLWWRNLVKNKRTQRRRWGAAEIGPLPFCYRTCGQEARVSSVSWEMAFVFRKCDLFEERVESGGHCLELLGILKVEVTTIYWLQQ